MDVQEAATIMSSVANVVTLAFSVGMIVRKEIQMP
jgi:hypothetical protein